MIPSLIQHFSESLYDLHQIKRTQEESKATKRRMAATMLVGAPILLVWGFIYLFFGEMVAFILFSAYALILLALLITIKLRRIRLSLVINIYRHPFSD